jgi:pimeloyl-ACP methyl ester carboxylesterase
VLRHRFTLAALIGSALLASACSPADPTELARENSWDLAREHGRFVPVNDLEMFAIAVGSGPDVVLVHGMIDSTFTWRLLVPLLEPHYRVHLVDLPGFGFSDKPGDATYTTEWLAEHLIGYLDAAGIERALLVGNSMGGHVASEAAMLHPERVAALVLLEASGVPVEGPDEVEVEVEGEEPWVVSLLKRPMGQALVRMLPTRGVLRENLEPAYFDPAELSEERLSAWHAPLETDNGMAAYLARSGRRVPAERAARIRALRVPTLVITGDTDRMVPIAIAQRYHALLPVSELLVWRDTGHMIQEQHPQRVAEAIRDWDDRRP